MYRNLLFKRFASTGAPHTSSGLSIPRRPLKKIRIGKARPAIYHKFDVKVELSDGSVITRKSQFPKEEIRLIQDQRNNPLWNPSRDDLVVVDANSGGSMDKFKQKYSSVFAVAEEERVSSTSSNEVADASNSMSEKQAAKIEKKADSEQVDSFGVADYLSLLDDQSAQIKSGKLATKVRDKKK